MATLSWQTPQGRRGCRLSATTTIGRSPQVDIALRDPGVSGLHARILYLGQAWILEDLGSTNGTLVNDVPQKRCELRDGDVLRLGNVVLTFHSAEPSGTPTLLWRRGLSSSPVPAGAEAGSPADREGTTLDDLLGEGTPYKRVSAVDSTRFSSDHEVTPDQDPTELARRLKASYEISCAAAATLDPSEILDRVLTALSAIFDQAERACIVLVDPASREVTTAAVKQRGPQTDADMAISRTALEEAMHTRQSFLCRDAAADERFAKSQSIVSLGIRSLMIAPLIFRDDVLGAVYIDSVSGVREFTQPDLELLSVAASQVAGCLANADLHEKVVATERLAAVGQTVAGVSHCVKNILQGIRGGAYILEKGLQEENLERVRSGWDMVKGNNAFMEELVYDLLTYAKEREPEREPADLNDLCNGVCELVGERASDRGVPLTFDPDPALGVVRVDPRGIRRCVLNLVTNAIDACEGCGGAVTVRTRAPGDDGLAHVIVRDTGSGMSQDTLAQLFTVFFSTKGSQGTGLGLAVTKKIIEEHGGRVDVASREGEGTTFTLAFPPKPVEKGDTSRAHARDESSNGPAPEP